MSYYKGKRLEEFPKQDDEQTELLVTKNIGLVYHIVNKHSVPSSEFEDYISVGIIGLIKASRTYDACKNIKFSTYAGRCISNEIIMYYRNHYTKWRELTYLDDPINIDSDGNALTLSNILTDNNNFRDEAELYKNRLEEIMQRIFNSLDNRNLIIYLAEVACWPLEKIARQLNITQSSVSDIMLKAKEKLNNHPKDIGNWRVSINDENLSLYGKNHYAIEFYIDDSLFDNLIKWQINIYSMPKSPYSRCKNNKIRRKRTSGLARIERAKMFGVYIIEQNATICKTANHFCVSNDTVHKDVVSVLPEVSQELFAGVQSVLARNKAERSIRSGEAIKQKYEEINARKNK